MKSEEQIMSRRKDRDIEGHWTCKRRADYDIDHGPATGYEIEELGITIYTYVNDHTRVSIHREEILK